MTDIAIQADRLAKRYRLGSAATRQDTLMGSLVALAKGPLENYRRLRRQSNFTEDENTSKEVLWALRDASFKIDHGEVIGLIGSNGAGKSTLLKIIARIVEPTSGRAVINGRVSSLLEVGTGFHPDLTGRENVYFNGILLGMSKAEMDRKFDEIVEFSGVERFIDTPVKRYSSGMLVRLAFSVAAHMEPEILLVDEVLAVGDATFQRKCMGKMQEVGQGGRTIIFVSHNLDAIRQLCPRALWFEHGALQSDGPVREVSQQYLTSLNTRRDDGTFRFTNEARGISVERVVLRNADGEEAHTFAPGDDLIVEMHYNASTPIDHPYFVLGVVSAKDSCFTANMLLDGQRPAELRGPGVVSCRFKALPLLPQTYTVKMMIWENNGRDLIMDYQEVTTFNVHADLEEYGYEGALLTTIAPRSTAVVVPYEWHLPDGTVSPVSLAKPGR